ncbi:MAG: hypothetical protein HYX92_07245 [Chloroflexi bacterium]|nr:hypothetical protein [Chloroflexota bacterium]
MGRIPSVLMVLALLLSGCTPGPTPAKAPPAAPAKAGEPAATPKPSAEQPRYGGILTVSNISPDPQDLDLVSDHRVPTLTIIRPAYSGLLQYDPFDHGKIVSELAERWEMAPDGKTYTFYLRKGVKWHDGRPFSSADAKFTLERMIDTSDPEKVRLLEKREAMSGITRVEAPDADTVKVTLKLPRGSFVPWMAWGSLVMAPRHVPPAQLASTPMGTGAFKYKSFARGSSLEVVKNPDFYVKGRPHLDGITFYIIRDQTTKMAAFRTGQLKLIRDFLPSSVKEIKQNMPNAVVQIADKLSFGYFGMNATKPPLNDIRIRRAASMVVDRPAAIEVLAEGFGALGTVMPPGEWARPQEEILKLPGYRRPKDVDVTEAKKLMAEAGFSSGFKTTMLSAARPDYERVAVFLADQLAKIGIEARLNLIEFAAYNRERAVGNFEVTAAGPGAAYIPDPAGHRKYYGRENFVGLKDERIFDLIDQQDAATDKAERKKLLWEMDSRLMEQAAIVILFWASMTTANWPEVRNFKEWSQFNNYAYTDVWLAK